MNVLLPVFLMNVLLPVFVMNVLLQVLPPLLHQSRYMCQPDRFGANYSFQYSYCCHEVVHLLLSSIVSSAWSSLRNQALCGRMSRQEAAQTLHHDEDEGLVASLCPIVL